MQALSSCCEQGLLFVAVHRLISVASLVAEHRLYVGAWASVVVAVGSQALEHRLCSCGVWY